MIVRRKNSFIALLPLMTMLGLFIAAIAGLVGVNSTPASAATIEPGFCRASIVFDRSSSVGTKDLLTLRKHVERLFQVGGIYDDKVELAFWSFSSNPYRKPVGYNNPLHDFVSSKGVHVGFSQSLAKLRAFGGTNYEQALAHADGKQNSDVKPIADRTDIIVFLTDGMPSPAGSREGARKAALKYYAEGRTILGGLIGTTSRHMNYVLNGSEKNGTNTFNVSGNYNDLSLVLKQQILKKCNELNPPCEYNAELPATSPDCKVTPYTLTPIVSANPSIREVGESVSYAYSITNGRTDSRPKVNYSTIGLRVNSGVSTGPVIGYTNGYKDDSSSSVAAIGNSLVAQLGGSSKAAVVSGGPSGVWTPSTGIGAESFAIPADARVGDKYCRILVIEKPTEANNPKYRYSSAACVAVGSKPKVHVYGGDVQVGRSFTNDSVRSLGSIVRTSTTRLGTKTFGSWSEYGIMAPGTITGMASRAGLQGGNMASTQNIWSSLSFANEETIGEFNDVASGWIPDITDALLRIYDKATAPRYSGNVALQPTHKGLYVASGDITLGSYDFSTPGQTIVIYAPSSTVTINGNLTYGSQRMSSLGEIPQLVIIADRINITSGVSRVDAWLVASGESGRIDTCSDITALSVLVCEKQLTITGPVTAKQLLLKRTAGAQGSDDISRDTPAEIFNMRADAYLWVYALTANERRVVTTYTSELSPRF